MKVNQTQTKRIEKDGQEFLRVTMSGKDYDLPFKVLSGKKVAFLDISGQVSLNEAAAEDIVELLYDAGVEFDTILNPVAKSNALAHAIALRWNKKKGTNIEKTVVARKSDGNKIQAVYRSVTTPRDQIMSLTDDDAQYLKGKKILVVDDDPIACEHALVVMEEAGIRADTALNGRTALDMLEVCHAKSDPYNLVLLDWKMPEMNGIEVAGEIRKRYSRETTIIILTAYNWDEIMDEALHIGVDSFLAKPLFASGVIDEFKRIARRNSMDMLKEKKRADLKGKRILLAEDILINAEIMKELLRIHEAEIDHAENGRIAVELFENHEPGYYDAILMDVRMPEMDGLEAAAAIRGLNRPDAETVPIIAMTANAFDEDVQRSLQVGMNAHLSKPVEPEHLYQTLGELIWESEN
mgnify:CR=1 FL=1